MPNDAATHKPWWKSIPWFSIINTGLIVAGVLGYWRDRVVVNEQKLEQQTVTMGEIKNAVQSTQGLVQKTSTDVEVLKTQQTNTQSIVEDVRRRQEQQGADILDLSKRVGVLEQRTRR